MHRQNNEIVDGKIRELACFEANGSFETSEVGAEPVVAGFCTHYAETKCFEQVVVLLQLNNEQAEQLKWSMLGEISKE